MPKLTRYGLIVLMILPALFLCRQAQAQDPKVSVGVQDDSSDVCGDKRSLIVVYVDEVSVQDSILGYNIEVRYNPEKLLLTDELFVSTLTEQFNDHKLTFPEPGIARGWGINIFRPVATTKKGQPLIAMGGRFLGSCTDTAEIEVSLISFTHVKDGDVFDVEGTIERKGVAKGFIQDRADRHVTARTGTQAVELKGVQTSEPISVSLINGAGKGITTATIELAIDNPGQFTVQDVVAAAHIQIVDTQSNNGLWTIKIAMEQGWVPENVLTFKIASIANKEDSAIVAVRPVQVNDCSCVTRLLGSGVELRSKEEISVAVAEQTESYSKKIRVAEADGGWRISSTEKMQFVRLATLLGRTVDVQYPFTTEAVFDNTQLSRGLYLLQIGTGQTQRTIIIEKL